MPNPQKNDKSQSIAGAIINLSLAVPPAIFSALAGKTLKFVNSYFQNMLEIVLEVNTNSRDWDHEVDKTKKLTKIIFFITTEVLKQPDVQKLFLEMVEQFKIMLDKVNVVLENTLEQSQEIIERQGDRASKSAYKVARTSVQSAKDGALDAAGTIPGLGQAISGIRAAADIIAPIQELTQNSLSLFLHTANDVVKTLKDQEVQGAEAAQASIKTIQTALELSDTVIKNIDALREGFSEAPIPQQKGGGNDYVMAANVPSPSFSPASKKAYDMAGEERAGLTLPPKIKKVFSEMAKVAKAAADAKKRVEDAKKMANDAKGSIASAKGSIADAKKMASNIKDAPGKMKQDISNSINSVKNNVKKSANNVKKSANNIKKSTSKKAPVGGKRGKKGKNSRRSTQRRKTKSKSRKRNTKKNKTY
jgi:hypothetical protein